MGTLSYFWRVRLRKVWQQRKFLIGYKNFYVLKNAMKNSLSDLTVQSYAKYPIQYILSSSKIELVQQVCGLLPTWNKLLCNFCHFSICEITNKDFKLNILGKDKYVVNWDLQIISVLTFCGALQFLSLVLDNF